MKPYSLHPEALDELQQQAVYYEERSEGLGSRFTDQVEAAALGLTGNVLAPLTRCWSR